MKTGNKTVERRTVRSKKLVVLLALLVSVAGGLAWLLVPAPDPLFRGKPESAWIKGIVYHGGDEKAPGGPK